MTDFKKIANYIDFIGTVGNGSDSEQLTTVLPDNSLILGFQLGEQVYERFGKKKQAMTTAGLCGQLTEKKEYLNTPNSQTILVKFKPWSAGLFFNGIENLTNQNTDLSLLILQNTFYQTLDRFYSESDKLKVVKSFLLQQFHHKKIDTSICTAIHLIEKSEGKIRVDKLAYEVCSSKRNFERKFKSVTGLSPKKFIDNIRFQHSLKRLQTNTDLQEIAYCSGYYDLPHFINDFKSVTGTTPEKFAF
jgi:AraC-like DNA-binding protein